MVIAVLVMELLGGDLVGGWVEFTQQLFQDVLGLFEVGEVVVAEGLD